MKILSPCIPKKIRSFFCSKLIDIFYHLFLNDAIFGRVTCPHNDRRRDQVSFRVYV